MYKSKYTWLCVYYPTPVTVHIHTRSRSCRRWMNILSRAMTPSSLCFSNRSPSSTFGVISCLLKLHCRYTHTSNTNINDTRGSCIHYSSCSATAEHRSTVRVVRILHQKIQNSANVTGKFCAGVSWILGTLLQANFSTLKLSLPLLYDPVCPYCIVNL